MIYVMPLFSGISVIQRDLRGKLERITLPVLREIRNRTRFLPFIPDLIKAKSFDRLIRHD